MPLEELLGFDYYGRVAVAASQAALHHGRALLVLPGVQSASHLASFGLDGLIVLDPIVDDPRLALLDGLATRTVLMGQDPRGAFGPAVTIDTAGSTRALLDHCWERGARTIGMINSDLPWSATDTARDAYTAWCSERGVEPHVAIAPATSVQSRPELAQVAKQTAIDMLRGSDRPDAILGMLEDFGRGIVLAARELGLDVPGDLLVAQDIDDAVASAGGITALDLNVHTQLDIALEMLISEEPPPVEETRLVSATLVPRESTRGLAR
jgi:DNA-binding LacI/PurR family transcriptional regulator